MKPAIIVLALVVAACGGATSPTAPPSGASVVPSTVVTEPTARAELTAKPRDWTLELANAGGNCDQIDQLAADFVNAAPTDQQAAAAAIRAAVLVCHPELAPAPSPQIAKVGEGVLVGDSTGTAIVTLVKVGEFKAGSGIQACDLGKCLTTQVSIAGQSGTMEWSPSDFTIVTKDGDIYETTGLYQEPSLPYDNTITGGKKVRGWLTYDVPKSLKHGTLHVEQGADIVF